MYYEGEWFDLPTFFQRLGDLPRLEPPAHNDINEIYNEYSPMQASEVSLTKSDDNDGYNKGEINQYQHQTTCDHFVKDSMETLTSRDHLNTESGDTGENSFSCLVQTPLCGNDNVGKFETFMDEDAESRIVSDPSLELKSEASTEDAFFGIDLTKENLGCNLENIDSSYQLSFSKAIKEGKPRIADDSSLGPKTEASVRETLFGNDRNAENPEQIQKAIPEDKFRIGGDLSFGLKSKVSVKETLFGNYKSTEYPEKIQNDLQDDQSINNDPSFELKVSVEENLLDCDEDTESADEVIPDGSSFTEYKDNNPPSAEKDEYTNYYPTPITTMMRVIRNDRSLDEDRILRCKIEGFTCNFCREKFSSRDELREHKRGYVSFVPSRAHICSRLSQRYCIVLGYNSSRCVQFKCSHCQKRFKCFGDYARHCNNGQICKRQRNYLASPFVQQCRLDNGERGFECLMCQESSTVYAELKFHECVISRDLPPEKCCDDPPANEDCDGDGSEEDSEDESFKCHLCGVEFRDTMSYADHQREHVRGEKYECKVCYRSFKRLCSFKTHIAHSFQERHISKITNF